MSDDEVQSAEEVQAHFSGPVQVGFDWWEAVLVDDLGLDQIVSSNP